MDELDLRTLKCPLPALLTRKALGGAAPGSVLAVRADDPLAVLDIPHMCRQEGHEVLAVSNEDGHHLFRIRRAQAPPAAPDAG